MELPDPRYPRLTRPRPSLVDDFFAPHARPRSLSGAPAPALLHPNSRLTGRPRLDARPIGTSKLVRPEFLLVELRDGRPGLVAVADLTRVWTQPRHPHLPTTPSRWDQFLAAISPKAGFILYAPDSALPNAEDPNQYLRHGFVYDAIDVGLLKQTMDMSGAKWEEAATASKWFNNLMNYFAYPFKNALSLRDGVKAVEAVQERVVGAPKIKLLVYSGHKTSDAQIARDFFNYEKTHKFDDGAGGDGHYFPRVRADGTTVDSAYTVKAYNHGRFVGNIVSIPGR